MGYYSPKKDQWTASICLALSLKNTFIIKTLEKYNICELVYGSEMKTLCIGQTMCEP